MKPELQRETHLSAKPSRAQTPPRFPQAIADQGRPQGAHPAPRQGPQAVVGLTAATGAAGKIAPAASLPKGAVVRLVMLERRSEFLRVRGGRRWTGPAFILEARAQTGPDAGAHPPRFGFTVTKKLGKAVVRNRIRRRLREAVRVSATQCARAGFDYVIVARAAASTASFASLESDLVRAFERVHGRPERQGRS